MKNLVSLIYISVIAVSSFAQDYNDVLLMFNNKQPTGSTYSLKDVLDTDTLKTNHEDLTIVGFICSSICQIDWEVKHTSNLLSSVAKRYIKNCASKQKSRVYFLNIRVVNNQGKTISLGERQIIIKKE